MGNRKLAKRLLLPPQSVLYALLLTRTFQRPSHVENRWRKCSNILSASKSRPSAPSAPRVSSTNKLNPSAYRYENMFSEDEFNSWMSDTVRLSPPISCCRTPLIPSH